VTVRPVEAAERVQPVNRLQISRDDLELWLWGVLRAHGSPWKIHMTDLAMRGMVSDDRELQQAIVLAGLQRRVWNGSREDAACFTLAGGALRVYERLHEHAPTQAPGPYVCVGDRRVTATGQVIGGPGCGLVFTAARKAKCCPLCNKSRIAYKHLAGDVVMWADPWDPGCRKLRLYRVCQHCRETAFEATRMDARYCSKRCKTAACRARAAST